MPVFNLSDKEGGVNDNSPQMMKQAPRMLKDLRTPALNIPAHNIRIMTNDLLSSDPSHHYAGAYHH
jgi:hypothetical protein